MTKYSHIADRGRVSIERNNVASVEYPTESNGPQIKGPRFRRRRCGVLEDIFGRPLELRGYISPLVEKTPCIINCPQPLGVGNAYRLCDLELRERIGIRFGHPAVVDRDGCTFVKIVDIRESRCR
jgi:hypothetical protein